MPSNSPKVSLVKLDAHRGEAIGCHLDAIKDKENLSLVDIFEHITEFVQACSKWYETMMSNMHNFSWNPLVLSLDNN